MFKLIMRFQDTTVKEYTFDNVPVKIGRRDDNDVVIDNMAVSGHHASIEKEESNYYVVVDQGSLNGTFINEKKVERAHIYDGDTIIIGKHALKFEDLRPKGERPLRIPGEELDRPAGGYRDTVILDTKAQQELLAKHAAERGISLDAPREKPKKVELYGSLTILSGGIPQIIDLDKRLTVLGKSDDADVKCSGLLVGKTAALINKRPNGYFLAYAEGMKKPEVNGEAVTTQLQLHDGDQITVGNTRMTFHLREEIS